MHPLLFSVGPISLYAYGLMVALGYLAAILVSLYFAKKERIKGELILDLAVYVIVFSILGARLFYVLGQWDQYKDNLLEILMLQKGGLVVLGGILFSMLAIMWFAKKKGIPALKLFDILSPAVALGMALGRIGCFLNGCCFGLPTKVFWGMVFPPASLAYAYFPGEHLHPTQLYSFLGDFFVFAILLWIYHRKKYDGHVFYWWLVLYSSCRFLIEFFRYSPFHWLGITPSQWIVVVMFGIGIYNLIKNQKQIV